MWSSPTPTRTATMTTCNERANPLCVCDSAGVSAGRTLAWIRFGPDLRRVHGIACYAYEHTPVRFVRVFRITARKYFR